MKLVQIKVINFFRKKTSSGYVEFLFIEQKKTPTQVFFCEYCEIFENSLLQDTSSGCFCFDMMFLNEK